MKRKPGSRPRRGPRRGPDTRDHSTPPRRESEREPRTLVDVLRGEKERLNRASIAGRVALWEWDISTGTVEWTSVVDSMLGFQPGGLPRTVQGWGSCIHREDLPAMIGALDRHLRKRTPYEAVYRIRRADGEYVWWHDVGCAERDGGGRPFRMAGSCVDITKTKRAEEDIRIRDTAIASSNSAILLANSLGVVTYVNRAFLELWGFGGEAEVLNRDVKEFWDPEEKIVELIKTLLDQGGWMGELRGRRKDNTLFDVEAVASLAIDDAGRTIGMMGSFVDITPRRRAESKIRRLAAAVEQVAQSVIITDTSGIIQYVNAAFTATTGYKREEVFDKTPAILKSGLHDPAHYERLWRTILAGQTWKGRFTNRRKDGSRYEVEATITPVRDSLGSITSFVGLEQDVTEQLAVRRRFQEQEKLAAIGGIAAGIAHEVKNPLFAISSGIQLLQEELVLDDEQRKTFEIIYGDVMRMDRLVRQLQLLSARPRLNRTVQPVADLIQAAITLNRGLAAEKSLTISDCIAPNLPDLVVDRDQLLQVLFNLIQNAIFVSPRGARIEATAEAEPDRASVIIKVRDEGPGIPGDLTERIFEPFFTTKKSSAGMGLAISRRIALDHGGSLTAENHPQGGAVFALELPVEPVEELV
jgi:two-component system, cell cycle sensor histidine kinase and response regulator CckA